MVLFINILRYDSGKSSVNMTPFVAL